MKLHKDTDAFKVLISNISERTGYREDALQRFGRVKIEATSFTISEPMKKLKVSAMLYDYALDQERDVLEKEYDLKPFEIETISLERAFIDKLFAAEAYVRASDNNQRAFEAAKHIYDLAVLEQQPFIQSFIRDNSLMRKILDIRLDEEMGRLDGIPEVKPKDFRFFQNIETNQNIKRAYQVMQNQYVMLEKDRIPFDDVVNSVKRIEKSLKESDAWMK